MSLKNKVIFLNNIHRIANSLKMITAAKLMQSKKLLTIAYKFQQEVESFYIHTLPESREAHMDYQHDYKHDHADQRQDLLINTPLCLLVTADTGFCSDYISKLNKLEPNVSATWCVIGSKVPHAYRPIGFMIRDDVESIAVQAAQHKRIHIYSWLDKTWPVITSLHIHSYLDAIAKINLYRMKALVVEQSKRMLATNQAAKNSEELIVQVKRALNKQRQDAITNELNEIISATL